MSFCQSHWDLQVTAYLHAQQEVKERRYRASNRDAAPGKQHSLQIPGHWDPMPPDEDHRLVDILAPAEDEYWGDLEGWQVCDMSSAHRSPITLWSLYDAEHC